MPSGARPKKRPLTPQPPTKPPKGPKSNQRLKPRPGYVGGKKVQKG